MKIYHNPRCRKSREGLAYLENKSSDFEIVQYLSDSLSEDDLREILLKLNVKPQELVRTQEEYFKKNLKGKDFTDDEWVKIIVENPKLLQRPIVVSKTKAVLAQPPEEIDKLL
jgi:arsenate reductase (glutaredoxin)